MIITQYNDFLFETNEKDKVFPLIISERLLKFLKSLDSQIARKILHDYSNNVCHDLSFLDCVVDDKDKMDKITFLPVNKIVKGILSDTHVNMDVNFNAKGRQEISVGRLINRLYPEVFSKNEVEIFVNQYKADIAKGHSDFYLASGEEIRHWYFSGNYSSNLGTINNSCMRGKLAQSYFDIYVNNPEKIKLLVLFSDKSKTKIKGRALVWFGLKKPIEIVDDKKIESKVYLDRIYTVADSDVELYKNYAKQNGWLYKAAQVMNDASYIENGKVIRNTVAITLKPKAYKAYPSLDTFCYYTPSTGRLASYAGLGIPGHPRYILNHTDGGASKID